MKKPTIFEDETISYKTKQSTMNQFVVRKTKMSTQAAITPNGTLPTMKGKVGKVNDSPVKREVLSECIDEYG